MKLEINNRKKMRKKSDYMEPKQHAIKKLMGQWVNQNDIKQYLETNDNKNTTIQNLWDSARAVLRGKFTAMQPIPKTKKIAKQQCNLLLKWLEKRPKKSKVCRRKEVIKIREEVNKIEVQNNRKNHSNQEWFPWKSKQSWHESWWSD